MSMITKLSEAVRQGDVDGVRRLLVDDPSLANAQVAEGVPVLQLAIGCVWPDVVHLLLEHGADTSLGSDKWTALHDAVQVGDERIVRSVLSHGVDVNAGDGNYTALHAAVDHPALLEMLMQYGADPNVKDRAGANPVESAGLASVDLFMSWGTDINAQDDSGGTLLHQAASDADYDKVRLLLDRGADATLRDRDGRTAITLAARSNVWKITELDSIGNILREYGGSAERAEVLSILAQAVPRNVPDIFEAAVLGDAERVEELVKQDESLVQARDAEGYTALHYAAMTGNTEVVRLLLWRGLDVDARTGRDRADETPLLLAATYGHSETAELLIAYGADINASDDIGHTPLMEALWPHDCKTVRLLIESGADVNARDDDGDTALCQAASVGCTEYVSLLLEHGAEVNMRGCMGYTPLHSGADGHPDIVRMLLQESVDVQARDDWGETPLRKATSSGCEECIRLLREAGEPLTEDLVAVGDVEELERRLEADPSLLNMRNAQGQSLLHHAAETGQVAAAEFLLKKGLNPNALNNRGETPLHLAAKELHMSVARLLLASGADVNAHGADGHSPLHEAAYTYEKCPVEVVKLLIDNGADLNYRAGCGSTPLGDAHRNDVKQLLWRAGGLP